MCHLDDWPKIPLNDFKLRNCLFGATNVVNYSDKKKWVYSGYAIAFSRASSWRFGNDNAKNIVIFGFDNRSSSHADNRKNVLMLGEGPSYGINGRFVAPGKMFYNNYSKTKTKYCSNLHYNGENSYLFVNGKEIFKFKAENNNVSFPTKFCLGSFLVNYNTIVMSSTSTSISWLGII